MSSPEPDASLYDKLVDQVDHAKENLEKIKENLTLSRSDYKGAEGSKSNYNIYYYLTIGVVIIGISAFFGPDLFKLVFKGTISDDDDDAPGDNARGGYFDFLPQEVKDRLNADSAASGPSSSAKGKGKEVDITIDDDVFSSRSTSPVNTNDPALTQNHFADASPQASSSAQQASPSTPQASSSGRDPKMQAAYDKYFTVKDENEDDGNDSDSTIKEEPKSRRKRRRAAKEFPNYNR
jgi:hypothetical protein